MALKIDDESLLSVQIVESDVHELVTSVGNSLEVEFVVTFDQGRRDDRAPWVGATEARCDFKSVLLSLLDRIRMLLQVAKGRRNHGGRGRTAARLDDTLRRRLLIRVVIV